MGLDVVELIMTLEEELGVDIADAEAQQATTPRTLVDLIHAKEQRTDKQVCVTQRAFYVLRKAFMQVFKTPRSSITPDTPLRDFVPDARAVEYWGELQRAVQARSWLWPLLSRPSWLFWSLACVVVCVFLWVSFGMWRVSSNLVLSGAVAAPLAIGVACVSAFLTRPFKNRISPGLRQVRDLVPFATSSTQMQWTRDQVSEIIRQNVIEQFGIREQEYSEDAHIVNDFSIG